MKASKDDLKAAAKELKDKTPPPMNTMMEKQSRVDALAKREARSKMVTENIPPTTPGICFLSMPIMNTSITKSFISLITIVPKVSAKKKKERQPPKCSLCKQPMKGHKNVPNCPRNKKN